MSLVVQATNFFTMRQILDQFKNEFLSHFVYICNLLTPESLLPASGSCIYLGTASSS